MTNIISGFKDVFISRLKNLFFINFIIAWSLINYNITLTVLFEDSKISDKIDFIKTNLTISDTNYMSIIIFPIILTFVYIFLLPLLNLWLNILYDKYIKDHEENHKNKKLKNYYDKQKTVEESRLENTKFIEEKIKNKLQKVANEEETIRINLAEEDRKIRQAQSDLKKEENIIIDNRTKLIEKEIIEIERKMATTKTHHNLNLTVLTYDELMDKNNKNLIENEELKKEIKYIESKLENTQIELQDYEEKEKKKNQFNDEFQTNAGLLKFGQTLTELNLQKNNNKKKSDDLKLKLGVNLKDNKTNDGLAKMGKLSASSAMAGALKNSSMAGVLEKVYNRKGSD